MTGMGVGNWRHEPTKGVEATVWGERWPLMLVFTYANGKVEHCSCGVVAKNVVIDVKK